MADDWPSDLPQCFNVPFSGGMGDGRLAYTPDQGPDITRKRSSSVIDPVSGEMRMTRAQIATLRTFVKTTLLEGSQPFNFKDPTSLDTVLVRFPKDKLPSWVQIGGGIFRVSMELEILP